MKDRIILNLCAGTGAWTRPYEAAGYDVRCVTLPDGDVLTYNPPAHVWGIVASPPCTEFSIAKRGERDLAGGLEIVDACLRIVRTCRLSGGLKWWGLENPRGFLRQFLGIPAFSVEFWRFGDSLQKPTDVWGYFRHPMFTVFEKPAGLKQVLRDYHNWDGKAAERRAITPPGFAKAFFKANR